MGHRIFAWKPLVKTTLVLFFAFLHPYLFMIKIFLSVTELVLLFFHRLALIAVADPATDLGASLLDISSARLVCSLCMCYGNWCRGEIE